MNIQIEDHVRVARILLLICSLVGLTGAAGAVDLHPLQPVATESPRETLLGEKNTAYVRQPGTDWPETDHAHHADLTARLKHSYDILRRWDFDVPPTKAYQPPKFR